ncbi:S8 family peptidase [Thiomicrorhabdus lithotrophica]|uniref:S8 family serine peptidase n=1 Tax=Thiomicrorhabdus lithotrophica TaxID=2949997 RepID=A0ABY8CBJ4_9GAMM|nr:S8 family serine peptidase [Thiomicrorhabdus lithotrophica]WEJ61783.1 S8 family serine peptidase [Thiomicrorhabdus lithotrophica]
MKLDLCEITKVVCQKRDATFTQNKQANKLKHYPRGYFTRTLISVLILTSLTACGGGGGGGSTTPVLPDPEYIIPIEPISVADVPLSGTYKQQTITNADDVWALGHKGQNITIGVVDSGVNQNHVDFYDDNGYSRINWTDARSIEYILAEDSIDYTYDYRDIDTPDFHGTHVSSIALGREYGIAPEATLLPVNVFFDKGSAYNIAIHEAVTYLASKAPIINASITGMVNFSNVGGSSSEFNSYLTTLQTYDSALVVAAGNGDSIGNDNIGDPIGAEHFNNTTVQNLAIESSIDNQVLSVIAIDDSGVRANFSDYPGSCADVIGGCNDSEALTMTEIQNTFISAPGTFIEAADGSNTTGSVSYSGTSMAAPVVSGGLALLMSAWNQLTIQDAVRILKETANNTGVYANASIYGVGLIDILAAIGPIGDLESSASSTASYSLTESTASIPASLSGLAKISALKSVAYFDDYNRDYSVDITPAIRIEKTPLDWNQFWVNSHSNLATSVELDDYALSVSFDNTQYKAIKSLALQNQYSTFQYFKNSSNSVIETSNNPLASNFYSNNQQDFGATLVMQQAITPKLALFTAVQEQDNSFSRVQNTQNETLAQVQTMGLSYQLTHNLSLGLSSQLRQEQDSLMGLQGSGTFSFGENNQSQLNTLSLQYSYNDIQLFSQFQQGQLLSSNQAPGSYINIEQAEMGQFKLGVMQILSPQTSWGLQTFNYNRLLQSDISLTLPVGMNSTGKVENQTIRYSQKNSLQPDTVELFYKAGSANALKFQLNAIHSPDDSGFGLKLYQRF